MGFAIEGVTELLKKLDELSNESFEESLKTSCALVERSAKQKAPKGDGDLRRSITSKVESREGIVFSPLLYAPYVEYGTGLFAESAGRTDVPWVYCDEKGNWHTTSGMKPQPYMRPALEENRDKILKVFKEDILK